MVSRGGDHELDVAGILRRARDPDDLGQLRRAIEELQSRQSTEWIAELLDRMQAQLRQLTNAVEALATRPDPTGGDNLVDVGGMDAFTVRALLNPMEHHRVYIEPPREPYFVAYAIAVDMVGPDYTRVPDVSIERVEIHACPQTQGAFDASRWAAPPGRGHPIRWLFGAATLAAECRVELRSHEADAVRVRITVFGKPLVRLPPGWSVGRPYHGMGLPRGRSPFFNPDR